MVNQARARLDKIAIVVDDYDQAIAFFTKALAFELVEDSPSLTNDGRPKRWVVVRPPGAETGILLARADGQEQAAAVGNQFAGRVGLFLQVDDFDAAHERMTAAGVEFVTAPRTEPYGRLAVFRDIAGNRWDLLGPPAPPERNTRVPEPPEDLRASGRHEGFDRRALDRHAAAGRRARRGFRAMATTADAQNRITQPTARRPGHNGPGLSTHACPAV